MNNYSRSMEIRKPAISGRGGMVTANHRVAAMAGAGILEAGGHAADAAIATSLMLGVCEPWMSGIGGCGHMLVYSAATGTVEAIDFSTVSPQNLDPADYPLSDRHSDNLFGWPAVEGERNNIGAMSAGLPTMLRGLDVLHRRHGRLPWADLVLPAARQAETGLEIDAYASLFITSAARDLAGDPGARAQFLDPDGLPPTIAWTSGNILRRPMPRLARTLRAIARDGADIFYDGAIGAALVAGLQRHGSRMTMADMSACAPTPGPARMTIFDGQAIHVSPEMNAGPDLQEVFSRCTANPGPVTPDELLSLIGDLRRVQEQREENTRLPEDGCTTHFNVVDRDGNMVVVTQTLLSVFGSRMLCGETGILMNNGLLWFDPRPGRRNSIGPGKIPLSNMCPAIVTGRDDGRSGGKGRSGGRGGGSVLGIGAAGGRRILPAVCQILWRLLCKGESLEAAFHAPRLDTSQAAAVSADRRMDPELLHAIGAQYPLQLAERHIYPYTFACPAAIRSAQGINTGCTETFSLWGDTILADDG